MSAALPDKESQSSSAESADHPVAGMPGQPGKPAKAGKVEHRAAWYLIAGSGNLSLRLRKALVVGESANGELTFDEPDIGRSLLRLLPDVHCVHVEVLDSSQHLVFVDGNRRAIGDTLALQAGTSIALPHNSIMLNTGIAGDNTGHRLALIPIAKIDEITVTAPLIQRAEIERAAQTAATSGDDDTRLPTVELRQEPASSPSIDDTVTLALDKTQTQTQSNVKTKAKEKALNSPTVILTETRDLPKAPPRRVWPSLAVASTVLVGALAYNQYQGGTTLPIPSLSSLSSYWNEQFENDSTTPSPSQPSATSSVQRPIPTTPPTTPVQTTPAPAKAAPAINTPVQAIPNTKIVVEDVQPEPVRPQLDLVAANQSSREVVEETTPATPITDPKIVRRLNRAKELLALGQITEPRNNNAVEQLELVLFQDPENIEALALIDQSADRMLSAASDARQVGLEFEARNLLEEILAFHPEHREAKRLWNEWTAPNPS